MRLTTDCCAAKPLSPLSIVFVFAYDNLRTTHIRDIRVAFKESRLFLGKNSVAQVALGRTPEEEVRDNLHYLSKRLDGDSGLMFTSRSKEEVIQYAPSWTLVSLTVTCLDRFFKNFSREDYAKAGAIASETIVLQPGHMSMFNTYCE